jgi:hypothetical protein
VFDPVHVIHASVRWSASGLGPFLSPFPGGVGGGAGGGGVGFGFAAIFGSTVAIFELGCEVFRKCAHAVRQTFGNVRAQLSPIADHVGILCGARDLLFPQIEVAARQFAEIWILCHI